MLACLSVCLFGCVFAWWCLLVWSFVSCGCLFVRLAPSVAWQAGQFSPPRVMVNRDRSVAEARQETSLGQASSAGVEGRRASQAEYVRLSALFCLLVGWFVGLFASLFVCLFVCLLVCWFVVLLGCWFVFLFFCVSVCLFLSFVPFVLWLLA